MRKYENKFKGNIKTSWRNKRKQIKEVLEQERKFENKWEIMISSWENKRTSWGKMRTSQGKKEFKLRTH